MERVAVFQDRKISYDSKPPFNPDRRYPELDSEIGSNKCYTTIREVFRMMGFDKKNYGKVGWNPLKRFISPGQRVLIKPNFVQDFHPDGRDIFSVIVHGSFLRPIVDYAWKALSGKGEIIIGDASETYADFEKVLELTGTREMVESLSKKGINIRIEDFRRKITIRENDIIVGEVVTDAGYRIIDLGKQSMFRGYLKNPGRIADADYRLKTGSKHHGERTNEYCISQEALKADVIINVPKLKTHKKAGITVCMKNLIGINADKNYLPHYLYGDRFCGGDEVPDPGCFGRMTIRTANAVVRYLVNRHTGKFFSILMKPVKKAKKSGKGKVLDDLYGIMGHDVRAGSWHGNDTLWRTIIDINRAIMYSDVSGKMKDDKQRRMLCIVDGITAGEGEGPMETIPRHCGIAICSENPVKCDIAAARLMGFDPRRIKSAENSFQIKKYPLAKGRDFTIVTNNPDWKRSVTYDKSLKFIPPKGWKGHLEAKNGV